MSSENGKLERLDTREKLAKYAAEHWGLDEEALLRAFRAWGDEQVWEWRERQRFSEAVYQYVGWWSTFWEHHCTGPSSHHHLHLALGDPLKIAYTPSNEYGRQDRQVVTTVGRYLKKYYPELSDEQIREWSDAHRDYHGEPVVFFAFGADDIQEVYHRGPRSCMGGDEHPPADFSGEYPCRVYDGPDTAVAFLKRGDKINARCVVRLDHTPMSYQRLYGDALLGMRLQALGFEDCSRGYSLDGVRLRLERAGDRIVCPYIDGSTMAEEAGEFLLIGAGPHGCQSTSGFVMKDVFLEEEEEDEACCTCCADWHAADDCTTDWRDEPLCLNCRDSDYVSAYCGLHHLEDYVHIDECIRVGDNWYRDDPDVLRYHDIVQDVEGEYRDLGDCIRDVNGDYHYGEDGLVYIESEGEYYPDDEVCTPWKRDELYPQYACTQFGGQWVHDDDVEEYEAQRKLELEAA